MIPGVSDPARQMSIKLQILLNFRENVSWNLLEIIPADLLDTLVLDCVKDRGSLSMQPHRWQPTSENRRAQEEQEEEYICVQNTLDVSVLVYFEGEHFSLHKIIPMRWLETRNNIESQNIAPGNVKLCRLYFLVAASSPGWAPLCSGFTHVCVCHQAVYFGTSQGG